MGRKESDFHKDELSIPHVTPFSITSQDLFPRFTSIHYRITNDTTMMLKVANMIRNYSNITDFYPFEAIIITMSWESSAYSEIEISISISLTVCE